jgi:hypothetical protein
MFHPINHPMPSGVPSIAATSLVRGRLIWRENKANSGQRAVHVIQVFLKSHTLKLLGKSAQNHRVKTKSAPEGRFSKL